MISIIICSRNKTINNDFIENIKSTIGCAYELIVIDNSQNQYSIFEAYNLGIEKSSGEFSCFIHDDVFFHTYGWGTIINRIFSENQDVGLIGVAGAKIKTKMPSAWWDCAENQKVIHIIQHFPNREKKKWNFGFENEQNTEVVAIDGVFMVMRNDKQIRFEDKMKGFHNYDLNISFEYIKKGYKIVVTNEVLIEHFSLGTLNEAWVRSTHKIHDIYIKLLPLGSREKLLSKNIEVANAKRFIDESLKYSLNTIAISVWMQLFRLNPISKYHYRFWKRILKEKLC